MMLHLLRNPEAEKVTRARAERVPVKNIRSFCSPSDFSLSIVTACERKQQQELGMKKLLLKVRADWEFLAVNSAGGSPSLTSPCPATQTLFPASFLTRDGDIVNFAVICVFCVVRVLGNWSVVAAAG